MHFTINDIYFIPEGTILPQHIYRVRLDYTVATPLLSEYAHWHIIVLATNCLQHKYVYFIVGTWVYSSN